MDIKNFYLQPPLDPLEYIHIKIADTPQEFIDKYNLKDFIDSKRWVYFHIRNGVYGLPQYRDLSQVLLEKRLKFHDYYQCPHTPGLWRHTWRPIIFCLLIDDFGVEYVVK